MLLNVESNNLWWMYVDSKKNIWEALFLTQFLMISSILYRLERADKPRTRHAYKRLLFLFTAAARQILMKPL